MCVEMRLQRLQESDPPGGLQAGQLSLGGQRAKSYPQDSPVSPLVP